MKIHAVNQNQNNNLSFNARLAIKDAANLISDSEVSHLDKLADKIGTPADMIDVHIEPIKNNNFFISILAKTRAGIKNISVSSVNDGFKSAFAALDKHLSELAGIPHLHSKSQEPSSLSEMRELSKLYDVSIMSHLADDLPPEPEPAGIGLFSHYAEDAKPEIQEDVNPFSHLADDD